MKFRGQHDRGKDQQQLERFLDQGKTVRLKIDVRTA